ncbi:MAG TPA: hypothetical protein VHP83_23290 [Aggregatilineaceae bacterium]|nr:hypothetical protein [Aggregatilineaceae bacterium]
MSEFTIEHSRTEPIVIVTERETYNPIEQMDLLIDAILAEVEHFDRPGYAIIVQKAKYNIDEVILGAQNIRVKGEKLRTHPKYRGSLFVSPYLFNKMALDGMSSDAFGKLFYQVFDTVEEALNFARSTL